MEVKPVARNQCAPFILEIHYAKRWPSISYAYGLFDGSELVGVVTYGSPFSHTLKRGIAGDEFKDQVLELNRLCLKYNRKNEASRLVGASLRMLPESIVVSFADTEQDHKGYVYQACNFLYCGLSAKRTDWKVKGKEHLHSTTISGEFRKQGKGRAAAMREKYGDDFYLAPRPRKHRYVYFVGSKSFKKRARKALRYKIEEYPK